MSTQTENLKVIGNPNKVDSFAACFTAVSKSLEKDVDYWYVEALAGTCFSPCLNKGEDCIGWMVDGANSARFEFIANAIGVDIQKIEQNSGAPENWPEIYARSKTIPDQVQRYFDSMKNVYECGGHVIMKTWPSWSVLTGWSEDYASLPFITTQGFESVVKSIWPPLKTREFYSLTKALDRMDIKSVIKEAIQFAYEIASNKISIESKEFNGEIVFGGALYDKVIEITNSEYLCPGCKEHGCFGRMIKRINDGHECSVAFLNYANTQLDSQYDTALINAIQLYTDLKTISGKYLNWKSFEPQYDKPEFRKELAGEFTKMKELHIEATKSLESLSSNL